MRVVGLLALVVLAGAAVADPAGRVRVIDADTWQVGGSKVRLFGIDAPERDQSCLAEDGTPWTCGIWATAQVRTAFQGKHADCIQLDTDRYRRIVARCLIDGHDVARQMVAQGWALAYRQYSMDYDLEEKAAFVAGRGLHRGSFQRPAEFRRASPVDGSARACAIKGNISRKGARIYHRPGQDHYARTRIDPSRGERWFCSADEAEAAGWRPARR